MRLIIILICFTLELCLFSQCKYITTGYGGGFTGKSIWYNLYPNGKITMGEGITDIKFSEYGKINKQLAKTYFKRIEEYSIPSFNYPGNIYYFISFKGKNKELKYTWGRSDYEVPDSVLILYKEINRLIEQSTLNN